MKHQIIDNFLGPSEFETLRQTMTHPSWPWYHIENITYDDGGDHTDSDRSQFCYMLYAQHTWGGAGEALMLPFLAALKPISLLRVKANLQVKTKTVMENAMHVDIASWLNEAQRLKGDSKNERNPLQDMVTGVFYVNSNNGETRFEDGTAVKSVANRMVLFPSNTRHSGTTCSDEKCRIVINFNYLPLVYPEELI